MKQSKFVVNSIDNFTLRINDFIYTKNKLFKTISNKLKYTNLENQRNSNS